MITKKDHAVVVWRAYNSESIAIDVDSQQMKHIKYYWTMSGEHAYDQDKSIGTSTDSEFSRTRASVVMAKPKENDEKTESWVWAKRGYVRVILTKIMLRNL